MSEARIAVAFDIDHTLAIDNKLERVAFLHLLERVVQDGGRALGSLADEIDRIDDLLATQRSGAFSVEEAVRRFTSERGVGSPDAYIDTFKQTALAMVDTFVVPAPDAAGTLDALARANIEVGVLSNGWNPLQIAKARRAGFQGTVLASGDLGAQKPQREAFQRLLEELDVEAGHCYYVGDDPRADVAGAVNAGLQGVWLDNEGKMYPPNAPPPTHTVASLAQLLAILPIAQHL